MLKASDRRLSDVCDIWRLCRARVPRARHVRCAADGQPDALAMACVDQPAADPVLAHRSTHAPHPLDYLSARAPSLPVAHHGPRRTTGGAWRPASRPGRSLADVASAPRARVCVVPCRTCAVSAPSRTRHAGARAGSVPTAASDGTAAGATAAGTTAAGATAVKAADAAGKTGGPAPAGRPAGPAATRATATANATAT